MKPRRKRPTFRFTWPYVVWVREELRNGRWVDLDIDPEIEEAQQAVREVLDMPGTTAQKKEAYEKVMSFYAETLAKLDDDPKV